jgi:light-regulated signal transduction histidine kinase (bacteriophytochrome)
VWLSTTKVALRDQRGDSIGLVGICHDITGRRAAEEKVAGLNRDLERRTRDLLTLNQELEAFSYSVSHDLRAPLRHIDGFAELAVKKAGPSLDEGGRRYLNMIAGSAKEMGQLIDDLLVFSRMGRTDLRAGTVSLDQLVKTVLRDLEPESQGRSVQWKIAELPSVEGDQAMLRVVFVNLLSNALKYTRTRETAEIEIGTKTGRAGETVIFVRDNGVGFDMRYADKLFGVFQRLHSSTDFEGTGIGLANVRRIISRHGGATWAEGVLDRGATVYFSLPPAHIAIAKTETEAVSCPT